MGQRSRGRLHGLREAEGAREGQAMRGDLGKARLAAPEHDRFSGVRQLGGQEAPDGSRAQYGKFHGGGFAHPFIVPEARN
ncbi:hypothetical protein D3C72_1833570 [compost metagenome]